MKHVKSIILGLIGIVFVFSIHTSCKKPKPEMTGKLDVKFSFVYDSVNFALNNDYTLLSGNIIHVRDVQFFISDICLIRDDGEKIYLQETDDAVYVDMGLNSSLGFQTYGPVASGVYKKVEFVFGFSKAKNVSNRFLNPPQSLMFWPETLGGGYHYMKINGTWKNHTDSAAHNFGLHLGRGQKWENGTAVEFYENAFPVSQDLNFVLAQGAILKLGIVMNIAEWFKNPDSWNFNEFGGSIMQNQEAMSTLRRNGHNVFTIKLL